MNGWSSMSFLSSMKQWTVIAGIVSLDQLSKHWIDSALGFVPMPPVIAGPYRHGFKLLSFITRELHSAFE